MDLDEVLVKAEDVYHIKQRIYRGQQLVIHAQTKQRVASFATEKTYNKFGRYRRLERISDFVRVLAEASISSAYRPNRFVQALLATSRRGRVPWLLRACVAVGGCIPSATAATIAIHRGRLSMMDTVTVFFHVLGVDMIWKLLHDFRVARNGTGQVVASCTGEEAWERIENRDIHRMADVNERRAWPLEV